MNLKTLKIGLIAAFLLSVTIVSITSAYEVLATGLTAPSTIGVVGGADAVVTITATGPGSEVLGAQLRMTFDQTAVQVVGATVTTGTCPVDTIAVNSVNNTTGDIFYAAANGAGGGIECGASFTVATITFSCVTATTTAISFTSGTPLDTVLSDRNGNDVTGSLTNGTITCDPAVPTGTDISGTIQLAVRSNIQWVGTVVQADDGVGGVYTDTTGIDGTFTITGVPNGTYTLTTNKNAYQNARKLNVAVSGTPIVMTTITLKAGEINQISPINITDISQITSRFFTAGPYPFDFDYQINNLINITDISAASVNFFSASPALWP